MTRIVASGSYVANGMNAVNSVFIIALILQFNKELTQVYKKIVSVGVFALALILLSDNVYIASTIGLVHNATNIINIVAKLTFIGENYKNKSTGSLAIETFILEWINFVIRTSAPFTESQDSNREI